MARWQTYLGEPFDPVTVWRDGVKCRTCQRVIRVREKCGFFAEQSATPPEGEVCGQYECRDCLHAEPINDLNREWREPHERDPRPVAGRVQSEPTARTANRRPAAAAKHSSRYRPRGRHDLDAD